MRRADFIAGSAAGLVSAFLVAWSTVGVGSYAADQDDSIVSYPTQPFVSVEQLSGRRAVGIGLAPVFFAGLGISYWKGIRGRVDVYVSMFLLAVAGASIGIVYAVLTDAIYNADIGGPVIIGFLGVYAFVALILWARLIRPIAARQA